MTDRRDFLKSAGAAALTTSLFTGKVRGANDKIAAAFIGMERSALHRKLKSLGLHGGVADERPAGETASA